MANLEIVAYKNVEAQYVEMMVPMYSHGCERKVKKALSHLKGIYSVNVEYNLQKVTVWGICNKMDVLTTIKSKRKDARFWNSKDNNGDDEQCVPYHQSTKPMFSPLLRSLSWRAVKKVLLKTASFRERSSLSLSL
ncbi:hypothetical protein ACHQM5_012048 [Ranunculus cassubicifolius]